ncbi:diguanylate cyclase [Cytobacillus firmus]|uniref:Diguanylate cyclase n=1 Tax=Cytobacillus firmus DS1 TaxID=1307436 RepID=W7L2V8_CYTFI|nr:diguanylate cyclase [Cytobacillus firmus]EWG09931.1 diguanylate cyclase [Cytobacillus firmus DS1]
MKIYQNALFGFVVLSLLASSIWNYYAFQSLENQSDRFINRLIPLEMTIGNIFKNLLNQETGMRGYIYSEDIKFLDPYNAGRERLDWNIAQIKVLSKDYPAISDYFHTHSLPQIKKIQSAFENEINAVSAAPSDFGISILASKKEMDIYRIQHEELLNLVTGEMELAMEHQKSASQRAKYFLIFAIIIAGVSVILLLSTYRKSSKAEHFMMLASLDGLTKIPNRRSLDHQLQKQWKKHLASKGNLGIILLDIDFFKKYNDEYGHILGDDVLAKVAETLHKTAKMQKCFAGRYGGEEFMIIMPKATKARMQSLGQTLNDKIMTLSIEHSQSPYKVLTISLGGAIGKPAADMLPQNLTQMADDMLYKSKENGRNQCHIQPI